MSQLVTNVKIYDLEESLKASGYPMRTKTEWEEPFDKTLSRCNKLSNAAKEVGAHDQFLSGIHVSFDLTFTNKAWVEAERYKFLVFVSSQSTMHRITKFDIANQYNKYVDPRIVKIMEEKVQKYNRLVGIMQSLSKENDKNPVFLEYLTNLLEEKYLEILYSNPAGFMLTARMTTNYRCLKNIWRQRRNHRLPEWREFCKWIETLPYAKELICI